MTVFIHPEFDQHESVHQFHDPATGLNAIIAIHSTALGPGAGGCRFWHYANPNDALTDALRLSRGMSFKNAVAGLPLGGGKAVILADKGVPKSPALFEAFGRAIDSLGGRYVTAEDVGMTVADIRVVARQTRYVTGMSERAASAGGDPSPWTALGVYEGIVAAVSTKIGADSVDGLRVAVQGVGNVGLQLCKLLHAAGAELVVADVNADNLARVQEAVPVTVVAPEEILFCAVDVLAPCALGNVLNVNTIERIQASVVAGAANNQLGEGADGARLAVRDILYAPDYVINAGGIINCGREYLGDCSEEQLRIEIGRIPDRLRGIFHEAQATGMPTNLVADALARRLLSQAATTDANLSSVVGA